MAGWVVITAGDVDDTRAGVCASAASTAAGLGQADPVPALIARVVALVRGEVAGCQRNVLDANTAKVPVSLKGVACRMIVAELLDFMSTTLTVADVSARRDDLALLAAVRGCALPVEPPDMAGSGFVQRGGGIEVVPEKRDGVSDRESLAGL